MSIRTDIIDVLRSPNCRRINFTLGTVRVSGAEYATIAQCVVNGHIQVVQSSVIASTMAAYYRKYNYFAVGSSPSRNLIVHEATHALNDWHKRTITDVDDEACAYVAQMVFTLIENPNLRNAIQNRASTGLAERFSQALRQCLSSEVLPLLDSNICNSAAVALAGILALELLAGRAMPLGTLQDLRTALDNDPNTHPGNTCEMRHYDGILHAAIPASELRELRGHLVAN